jgi:hypothetical protein
MVSGDPHTRGRRGIDRTTANIRPRPVACRRPGAPARHPAGTRRVRGGALLGGPLGAGARRFRGRGGPGDRRGTRDHRRRTRLGIWWLGKRFEKFDLTTAQN